MYMGVNHVSARAIEMHYCLISKSYEKHSRWNNPARALSYFSFCAKIFKGLDWHPGLKMRRSFLITIPLEASLQANLKT